MLTFFDFQVNPMDLPVFICLGNKEELIGAFFFSKSDKKRMKTLFIS